MTTINLDLLFERTLRSLMLVCDGRTASFEGRVSVSAEPDRSPKATERDEKGHTDYSIDDLLGRYEKTESCEQRRVVINDALEAVRQAKFAPSPPDGPLRGSKEWRQRIAADPRPITVISRDLGVSRPTVYKFKREFEDLAEAA